MRSPVLLLQSTNIHPSDPGFWQIVQTLISLGKFNQALSLAHSALQRDHSQQQQYHVHQNRTIMLGAEFAEEIGDYPRAIYYWERVLQEQPQNAKAWHGLGLAKANLEDYVGAMQALTQVLRLEPENHKARSQFTEIQHLINP